MAKITINGISIDPAAQAHALAATNLVAANASASDYILVQTKQPMDAQQKKDLLSLGADILEYVPENTYVCHYKPSDLASIRALPFVAWANTYMRGFKLAPALLTPAGDLKAANLLTAATGSGDMLSRQPREVDIVLQNNVLADKVRDKIAAAAHLAPSALKTSAHKIRLTVQHRYLKDLAAIDEVRHIEDVVPVKLHNNIARQILAVESNPGGPSPFQGEGQVVAVADTGFDKGSTTDVHPAFAGRVLQLYSLGRPGDASDPDGHGTHVAGSVLGDGLSTVLGFTIQGTAPKAKLVLQSVLDADGNLGGLPDDLNDLFNIPYVMNGARVHSNSWGDVHGDGSYSANSREVDEFVWNHRDCVICFAAGNDGKDKHGTGHVDPQSVGAPSTAKNCITVGATENNRPGFLPPAPALTYGNGWPSDFPADPIFSDPVADNIEGMAAFSGRGPTTDRRFKPDVVAPGTAILSTLSRAVDSPSGWGQTPDPLYFYEGGTSMATPLVAGCAALVREFLVKTQQNASPSAALVKALLINGAQAITGQYAPPEVAGIPDATQGFGRVNLRATVGPFDAGTSLTMKDEATKLDTGDQEQITLTIPEGAGLLKVTLAWTDPAGESLQNDLDLTVRTADGQERHGNMPATSTDFDRVNNVEQVLWQNPAAGDAVVLVKAFRVVNQLQPYALVARVA
jgi:hypothetical protein